MGLSRLPPRKTRTTGRSPGNARRSGAGTRTGAESSLVPARRGTTLARSGAGRPPGDNDPARLQPRPKPRLPRTPAPSTRPERKGTLSCGSSVALGILPHRSVCTPLFAFPTRDGDAVLLSLRAPAGIQQCPHVCRAFREASPAGVLPVPGPSARPARLGARLKPRLHSPAPPHQSRGAWRRPTRPS